MIELTGLSMLRGVVKDTSGPSAPTNQRLKQKLFRTEETHATPFIRIAAITRIYHILLDH